MVEINDSIFRQQINDDIKIIQETLSWDPNIQNTNYAFNYWILSKIYNLDEEASHSNITEYNDKGIDCFVHFEDVKELYIIQNKFYQESTQLASKEVTDFLLRPIATLQNNEYTKSLELQDIYDKAVNDGDYKIFQHLYVTNNNRSQDVDNLIKTQQKATKTGFYIDLFYLDSIKKKYYGESYNDDILLNFDLSLKLKASALRILPKEYNLKNMTKAFYVMAQIDEIHKLWGMAKSKNYPLFEKNIREYLGGTSGINKSIITTLKDENERHNFFYYNNGITIICENADVVQKKLKLTNPQIVNGCQTVSSIVEVFEGLKEGEEDQFVGTYVMTKVLVADKKKSKLFYLDIVKHTNSQNSINEKVFGAKRDLFIRLQKEIAKRGILLCVKQSDKNKFRDLYNKAKPKGKILKLANKHSAQFYKFKKLSEIQINLDRLIQIIVSIKKDAYVAYTKKPLLLTPSNKEYYENFSLNIYDYFTTKQMVKLIILYKKIEAEKKKTKEKTPHPSSYYLLNFMSVYLKQEGIKTAYFFEKVSMIQLEVIFNIFKGFSKAYQKNSKFEFNQMIKQKVKPELMISIINERLEVLEETNKPHFDEFKKIITSLKKQQAIVTSKSKNLINQQHGQFRV